MSEGTTSRGTHESEAEANKHRNKERISKLGSHMSQSKPAWDLQSEEW